MPYLAANVSVMDYNADPTGVSDSTAAFNEAALAVSNAGHGVVSIPEGTFTITPVSSTSAGIVLNNGTSGYYGVRFIGAGEDATMIQRTAAGPIFSMSGPATDTTGVTHCRWCSLENLTLNGENFTGTLIQTYYADNLEFRDVQFENSNGAGLDTAECWDSRYYNCLWDNCGSTTANTVAPALWLRNTAASSGFGFSGDTVNNIYFFGCRWEQCLSGSIRVERGVGTNTGQPYSLYFVSGKTETAVVNGNASIFVDTTARDIHFENFHCFQGGFQAGYSTAQDVITFGPQFGSLRDVLVFNSTASACIANGVTLNAPLANSYVIAESVRGSYTGGATPTGAHISFGTSTGNFRVMDCQADNGTQYGGTVPGSASEFIITNGNAAGTFTIKNSTAVTSANEADLVVIGASTSSNAFGVQVAGDTDLRFVQNTKGDATYGGGTSQDYISLRATTGVHAFSKSLQVGSITDIGSNAVGAFKYANATTVPTTNPTGGIVSYATSGAGYLRDPSGNVFSLMDATPIGTNVTGALAETIPYYQATTSAAPISGDLYIQSIFLAAGTVVGHIGFANTTATTAASHWWLVLLDNTYTVRAITADQTTTNLAATTWYKIATAASYTATYSGRYYLGAMFATSSGSQPTVAAGTAPIAAMITGTSAPTPLFGGLSSTGLTTPGTAGTTVYAAPTAAFTPIYMYAAV